MLQPDAPYPYPGSYALLSDPDLPAPQPTELVRIMWRRAERKVGKGGRSLEREFAMVSFPLRDGAGGNKVVPASELADATPLTDQETREFHDLDRALTGRFGPSVGEDGGRTRLTKRQKALKARRDDLKLRMVFAPMMERLLRTARARAAQQRRAA